MMPCLSKIISRSVRCLYHVYAGCLPNAILSEYLYIVCATALTALNLLNVCQASVM